MLFRTVVASGISLALGDSIDGLIIISMVLLSVLLNFFMEFQARHAVEAIRKQVATTATVRRDGHDQHLPIADLVPGDVVRLNAGDLVPADARLLNARDLHVRESALTGESLPVEKAVSDLPVGRRGLADASNSVFLGTAVQSGMGTAVIVRTGRATAFGEIANRLGMRPPETEFGRGTRHFGLMITRVIMLLVLFVLLVNIVLHRPLLESFVFSVALAVGMTPEMMPMIITVTLAQGARRMMPGYRANIRTKIADVRGASKGGAVEKLQETLEGIQTDLGTETPKGTVSRPVVVTSNPATGFSGFAASWRYRAFQSRTPPAPSASRHYRLQLVAGQLERHVEPVFRGVLK